MSLKILLYNPPYDKVYSRIGTLHQHNMALAYIASALEQKGHKVWIIDANIDNVYSEGLLSFIKKNEIGIIGVSATTPIIHIALEILATLKQNLKNIITIIGGVHASIFPKELCEKSEVDYVVYGEGEITVTELMNSIENNTSVEGIKGLAFKKDGNVIVNPSREYIKDLDILPFPARHLFSNHKYTYPNSLHKNVFAIHTSRGCPAKCKFCLAQHKVRFRSAKSVVDEMELLIKEHGAEEFHIWDDNFAADKRRVFKIRDEIISRKLKPVISFAAGIRVDTAMDIEVLKAMKEMGGYSIAFGIESGSQKILDSISKGTTLAQVEQAVKLSKQLGFEIWGFFMFGFPEENKEDVMQTIQFAMKLNPHIAKFHILKPYPGSEIHQEILQYGLLDDDNLENYSIHTYPVHHTKYLSREELNSFHKMAYRKFYFRPIAIYNQLLLLKTFFRVKFNFITALGIFRLIYSK